MQIRRGNKLYHAYHTKHGWANKHILYRCWKNVKQRCLNPNNQDYKIYGGKGIKICDEWLNDSGAFIRWGLSHGWKQGLVIDRIDSSRDYHPDNCQFITRSENSKKVKIENPTLHRGSNHRDTVLTEEIVKEIKKDISLGMNQSLVMKKYSISRNIAYQLKYNKTWKHVSI